MAGLVDLSGLKALQDFSVRIQSLDKKSKLDSSDVFLVDKLNYGEYSTRTIPYSILSSSILEGIENHPEVNLFGYWEFTKNNLMLVDTSQAIENAKAKNLQLSSKIAINRHYMENEVLNTIYDLSSELYSPTNPHVPSYIGQIVTSSTLSTIFEVKKVYGEYTDWEPLNQVFLCGEGKPSQNNYTKFGENVGDYDLSSIGMHSDGEVNTALTTDQIPKHTHKFKPKKSSFTITWYLSWINEVIDHVTTTGVQFYNAKNMVSIAHKYGFRTNVFQVKKATSASMTATFTGEGSISTTDFENLSLINAVYNPDDPAGSSPVSSSGRHNNMPPFVTEYVWKRKK